MPITGSFSPVAGIAFVISGSLAWPPNSARGSLAPSPASSAVCMILRRETYGTSSCDMINSHSRPLARRLCLVKALPEIDSCPIGQRNCPELVAQFHHLFRLSVESRPLWQSGTVGVPGLREIRPVGRHDVPDALILVLPRLVLDVAA